MESPPAEPQPPLTAQAFAATFNHLLQTQPWSRERLRRHAGKTLRVTLPPLSMLLAIGEDGMISAAQPGSEPEASLGVSPLALLSVLSSQPLPQELVHTSGDSGLAVDFGNVMQNLRWDAEEDLSKIFGDVLGHRMARGAAGFLSRTQQAAGNFAANLTEYWTEERPLLAKRPDIERFIREVDAVRDAAARLEKRVERLMQRADS
ncbi:MAG: SCP2 sterol-binding domain-containing protein [Sulfuricella sp.]|jgi:ubiquinone biosynthesis protein UbiJ|nr:SCP2 sterol-binding domain-containing protein [Sulfuricella sp.]